MANQRKMTQTMNYTTGGSEPVTIAIYFGAPRSQVERDHLRVGRDILIHNRIIDALMGAAPASIRDLDVAGWARAIANQDSTLKLIGAGRAPLYPIWGVDDDKQYDRMVSVHAAWSAAQRDSGADNGMI